MGENGAGKSTLTKILSGAIAPDAGTITVMGTTLKALSPRQSMALGISTVYQEAELIESLTVADNIFLGDERRAAFPVMVDTRVPERALSQRSSSCCTSSCGRTRWWRDLSSAQKQMLQIAKALYRDAKILIMDEPTSSLGLEEREPLMELIRTLKGKGIGIIYISHYLEEIFQIGDTLTILKDGESMGTSAVRDVDVETVIRRMVGRDQSLYYTRERVPLGAVQVEVRHLARDGVVNDVSFDVRKGEIFGVGGLVGSGRSEMVNLIFGVDRRDRGTSSSAGRRCACAARARPSAPASA